MISTSKKGSVWTWWMGVRSCVMKVHRTFFFGAYRSAMRLALQEIVSGMEVQNRFRILRGWELFILILRMLLFRRARCGKVQKKQLLDRLLNVGALKECETMLKFVLQRLSLLLKLANSLRHDRLWRVLSWPQATVPHWEP